jgi:hypothetical protein
MLLQPLLLYNLHHRQTSSARHGVAAKSVEIFKTLVGKGVGDLTIDGEANEVRRCSETMR